MPSIRISCSNILCKLLMFIPLVKLLVAAIWGVCVSVRICVEYCGDHLLADPQYPCLTEPFPMVPTSTGDPSLPSNIFLQGWNKWHIPTQRGHSLVLTTLIRSEMVLVLVLAYSKFQNYYWYFWNTFLSFFVV